MRELLYRSILALETWCVELKEGVLKEGVS